MVTVLEVFALVPTLITAVESIFHSFPGSGSVKKNVVVSAVDSIVTAANSLGAKIDAAFVSSTLGQLIDDYIAAQNALGTPGFVAAQTAIDHGTA